MTFNSYQFRVTEEFDTPSSSAIQSVRFDEGENLMAITFNHGTVTVYRGVPRSEFKAFRNAMSHGMFYNTRVKGAYPSSSYDTVHFISAQPAKQAFAETQELEAEATSGIQVTVNIYVNGDPEQIAKAVERLAPSVRAVQNWRG